jgi:hypothetical protein
MLVADFSSDIYLGPLLESSRTVDTVHLPPNREIFRDYPINMFYLLFKSRKDTHNAPISTWLHRGPGFINITSYGGERAMQNFERF